MFIVDNEASQKFKVMVKVYMYFQVYYWLQAIVIKEIECQDNHNKMNFKSCAWIWGVNSGGLNLPTNPLA